MRRTFSILAALIASYGFAAEKKDVLQLDVYPVGSMQPMEVHSIVTNLGDAPVTIPTHSYSDGVDGWVEGEGKVGIIFSIGFGSVGDHKLVPSPLRFFPVTLQPGESAELPLVHVTRREEKTVEVTFAVDEDYARRHGWWFGRLKKKVVIGEGSNPYIVEVPSFPPVASQKEKPNHSPEPARGAVH